MQRWEYQTWTVWETSGKGKIQSIDGLPIAQRSQKSLVISLANAGAEGWELVRTHAHTEYLVTYTLKRPKE